jgi:inosine-uridine nucleoside N-ribohydrolase
VRHLVACLALFPGLDASLQAAGPPARVSVLMDTDIGDELDDPLALAGLLSTPRVRLAGVTTVTGDSYTRALVACRFLEAVGRPDVPVASAAGPRPRPARDRHLVYGLGSGFRKRPEACDAVTLLHRQLKARPGQLTVLAIGPLTNVAALLRRHPECKPWIGRLVVMGGALEVGYSGKPPPEPEWNFHEDPGAARTVLASGVPIVLVPLDVTWNLSLSQDQLRRILGHGSPLTDQVAALYALWHRKSVVLFDPLAAVCCIDEGVCELKRACVEVDEKGMTRVVKGKPNVRLACKVDRDAVVGRFVRLVTSGRGKP